MSDGSRILFLPSDDPQTIGNSSDYKVILDTPFITNRNFHEVALVCITFTTVAPLPVNGIVWVYSSLVRGSIVGSGTFQTIGRFTGIDTAKEYTLYQEGIIPLYYPMAQNDPTAIEIQLSQDDGKPVNTSGITNAVLSVRPALTPEYSASNRL